MKFGKLTVDSTTGSMEFEDVEIVPEELPGLERLINSLKELQIATMHMETTRRATVPIPTEPQKCYVDGCNAPAIHSKPMKISGKTIFLWLCGEHLSIGEHLEG